MGDCRNSGNYNFVCNFNVFGASQPSIMCTVQEMTETVLEAERTRQVSTELTELQTNNNTLRQCVDELKQNLSAVSVSELRATIGVAAIRVTYRRNRLRWFGHVERKGGDDGEEVLNGGGGG
jgi:hypothetical protein